MEAWQVPLWDAINRYVVACGGDPDKHVYGNTTRQTAVSDVCNVVRDAVIEQIGSWRGMVKAMVRSATPRAKDNPTMWDLWGDAAVMLDHARDAFRVPHADLKDGESALRALRSGRTL